MAETSSDLFRFAALRPPQRSDVDPTTIVLVKRENAPATPFLSALISARATEGGLAQVQELAQRFISSNPAYRTAVDRIAPPLYSIAETALKTGLDGAAFRMSAESTLGRAFTDTLRQDRERLSDALIASAISGKADRERTLLTNGLRVVDLLERLIAQGPSTLNGSDIGKGLKAPVALPKSIFPLHHDDRPLRDQLRRVYESEQSKAADHIQKLREHIARLQENEVVHHELLTAYSREAASNGSPTTTVHETPSSTGFSNSGWSVLRGLFGNRAPSVTTTMIAIESRRPTLSPDASRGLSNGTRNALRRLGLDPDALELPRALAALESDSADAADKVYKDRGTGTTALIGNVHFNSERFGITLGSDSGDTLVPGPCQQMNTDNPAVSESTVPHGVGSYRSLGVMDLLIVRQRLLRYEMGEISHVANILKGEVETREHRRLRQTEEQLTREEEVSQETDRDLQSTERFQLERETQRTIEEDASREAGIQTTASYGPSFEVTANAGISTDTSRSESETMAHSRSREIVDRSAQRVRERIREVRMRRVLEETQENTTHTFDNNKGTDHVVGIYRWLDKVLESQVFNYGKREMLEFVVPEPAAFFRYAVSTGPTEGVSLERPNPPGYCDSVTHHFVPLEPKHISRHTYRYWAAVYGASDVKPPPPDLRVISLAIDQPYTGDEQPAVARSSTDLKVPIGYTAKRAWVNSGQANYAPSSTSTTPPSSPWGPPTPTPAPTASPSAAELFVFVGRHRVSGSVWLNDESDVVPIAVLGRYLLVYVVVVEVECLLESSFYEKWQLDTFGAVMQAYRELESKYQEELRRVTEVTSEGVRGRNPFFNREIERTELKKLVISMLTGQHFDDFDAMRRNVFPHHYPQMDIAEVAAEGRYIQFFEQALEWSNIQYLFYPYFWGRKNEWIHTSQIDDTDPLFGAFLRAGAARVQVPVRPGFEQAVNEFLNGIPDPGGTSLTSDNDPFLSIVEEMRDQQGAVYVKSGGTLSVTNGLNALTGDGTDFGGGDVDREITIAGRRYRIASVTGPTTLTLNEPYGGNTTAAVGYVVGARYVGEPWIVRLPTSLVILQQDDTLPDFTD